MRPFHAILLSAVLLGQSVLAGTPTEALAAFKKSAAAGDFDGAWKSTAKFDGLPEKITDYLKEKVKESVDLLSKDEDFETLEEKTEGDCAVVVVKDTNGGDGKVA